VNLFSHNTNVTYFLLPLLVLFDDLLLFDELEEEPELLFDEEDPDFTADDVLLEGELVTVLPELALPDEDLLTGAVDTGLDTLLLVFEFICGLVVVFGLVTEELFT
jgi:hypothetical protein